MILTEPRERISISKMIFPKNKLKNEKHARTNEKVEIWGVGIVYIPILINVGSF